MHSVKNRPSSPSRSSHLTSPHRKFILASSILLAIAGQAAAGNLYWDSNGATPGAGTSPVGTWGTSAFWSTDPTGSSATGAWSSTEVAVFSAGSDATGSFVLSTTSNGTQTAAGVLVEEGNITISNGTIDTGTGTFTIGNGAGSTARVNISAVGRLNTAGKVVLDGGTLYSNNSGGTGGSFISATKGLEITANGGFVGYDDLSSTNAFAIIYAGTITGTGGTTAAGVGTLTKVGPDEFRAQGAGMANNTFQKLVVKEGSYRLGNVSGANFETAFGAAPSSVMTDAITLDGGYIGTSVSISLVANRGIVIGPNGGGFDGVGTGTLTVPGPLSGSGKLIVKGGTGGVTLTNASNTSTFTGSVQVDLGTLTLSQSLNATNFSGAGGTVSIASGKVFTVGSDNTSTLYIGVVAGSGGIFTKVGSGVLSTRAEWTNTGITNINAGSIKYDVGAAGLGNSSQINIASGASLDMNNVTDTIGSLTGAGNVVNGANLTLTGNNGSTASFTGNYSGTAGSRVLAKNGTGIQQLSGNNDFTAVAFNDGRINFNSNTAVGTAVITVASTADEFVSTAAGVVLPNDVILSSGAAPKIYSTTGNALTLNGVISGAGGLLRDDTGAGALTFNGANTYNGGFKISSRGVSIGNKAGFGVGQLTIGDAVTAPANPISISATTNLTGANAVANAVTLNQSFTVGATSEAVEFSGTIAIAAGTPAVTVSSANPVTFSGGTAGSGGLSKAGTGTLILTGSATHFGATSVDAGTLLVNGTLSGTSGVTVAGTLGGTGTVFPSGTGGVSLSAGGKLAPGSTGAGNLNVTLTGGTVALSGGVTATGSAALVFELDTPAASDKVTVTGGPVDIGIAVLEFDDFNFTALGGFGQGTYTLFAGDTAITGTLGAVIDGTVGGLPAQIQLADSNTDLVLSVVPEPGSAALLMGGLAFLTAHRRKRR